jgi:hypothetical protein
MFPRCRYDITVFSPLMGLIENYGMLTIDGDIHLGVQVAEVEIERMPVSGMALGVESKRFLALIEGGLPKT